jgi:hypothetical protein
LKLDLDDLRADVKQSHIVTLTRRRRKKLRGVFRCLPMYAESDASIPLKIARITLIFIWQGSCRFFGYEYQIGSSVEYQIGSSVG